ncbi:uncharacterized protein LOC142230710 [Haematobia irritans]|uniref:uncharacterized protein LOC142230710 n=1 Tax=Haematobia irritans TaxID=7368 RepID=UPI003F4FFA25
MADLKNDADHSITVTHFINPHLFWYRKIGGPDDNFYILTLLEKRLQELYKNKPSTEARCRPAVGDKIAVHFVVWNKFIRAEVLQTAEFQQEEYIVWATDYGFPLLTKKEYVRKLPEVLAKPMGLIHLGGVSNTQPAVLDYDFAQSNLVMVKQDEWLQQACDMLEKLLADASSVIFVEQYETPGGEHKWGELLVSNHRGNKFNARDYLKSLKLAMDVDGRDFSQICSTLKTTKIAPWLSNCRKTKMKFNSIKHNMAEHTQQVNSAIIDECAKRKVEDWCERNARVEYDVGGNLEVLESAAEILPLDQSIDDITFDDSVSVIHKKKKMEKRAALLSSSHQHHSKSSKTDKNDDQLNYIGKAGGITKSKQKKYASEHSMPPEANAKAFEMDFKADNDNSAKLCPTPVSSCISAHINKQQQGFIQGQSTDYNGDEMHLTFTNDHKSNRTPTVLSTASNASSVLARINRAALARKKLTEENIQQQNLLSFSDTNLTIHSCATYAGPASSTSLRLQKLTEVRKRYEHEKKSLCGDNSETKACPTSPSSNHAANSRAQYLLSQRQKHKGASLHKDESLSAIHPYNEIEQSVTACNDNLFLDSTQDIPNDECTSTSRSKELSEKRRKIQTLSANDTFNNNSTPLTTDILEAFGNCKINESNATQETSNDSSFDSFNFKLRPKTSINNEQSQSCNDDLPRLPPTARSETEGKESNGGYDGLTLVPAGFDVTRLKKYRDEENHWHRKKSTRNEYIPHDESIISSSEEMLIPNVHEQSSSSSDFFQIKPPVVKHKPTVTSKRLTRPHSSKTSSLNSNAKDNTNILDSSIPSLAGSSSLIKPIKCSQLDDDNSLIKETQSNIVDSSVHRYPSEVSTTTSTHSTFESQNHTQKHLQLKSPQSQINKIEANLSQRNLEKDRRTSTLLDLTTSSHRDSLKSNNFHQILSDVTSNSSGTQKNRSESSKISSSTENKSICSDKSNENKHTKNILNYTTLLEVKHTEHLPIVQGEIKLQTKFIDHLVLAHSSVPLMPIENVAEASFLPEIHQEMRNMRVNKVYRIQVYSWSHVLRGNSLFVVNPARTGKTWSYLPALCSLVGFRYERLKPSYGPMTIIMVASSRHVESTYSCCRRLMIGLNGAPTCVASYGMRNFIDTKVQLLNGCGILIVTPSCLLRLLKDNNNNEPLFDSERLQHIIIDDMDTMLSRSHEDFESAVRILFKLAKKSRFKTLQPQLIVTSRDWDGVMIRLMRKSNQPLLLIGDFLEAAVYGRATLSVKLKSSVEKNDTILRFIEKQAQSLQGNIENRRILIMCTGDEDVEQVAEFISSCGYPCLAYYNRSTDSEKATVDEWKKNVSSQILICTDARFPELQIQNVHNLIHYSLPTSWTQFTTRFSSLSQTYDNFVCKNFEQSPIVATTSSPLVHANPAYSMILLDEENSLQLPRLVDFMRKHNQTIHPDILAVSKRVLVAREEMRICQGALVCPQLLEFGECDESRCDKRHELTRFDMIGENDDIPCSGEMRILILKVFSPTHYAARLLQHKPENSTKWHEVRSSSKNLNFTIQLDLHYRNQDNLFLHWPPHVNDLCMYKHADNFRRALILEAPSLEGKNVNIVQANLKATIKLVDDGTVINSVKCSELFVCDKKFQDFPFQAIDIRLMNIVPFDNERTWDSKTTKQVQTWIMDDIKSHHIVQVGVTFALAQTIWINNLIVMEKLSTLGTYRPYVNLKLSLVKKNFALMYKGERKHVQDIAKEYGLLKIPSKSMNVGEGGDTTELDTSIEDDEYESCQNDSVDLIKFSSSNGDGITNSSMESARNDVTTPDEEKGSLDFKDQLLANLKPADEEENWDELCNERQKSEMVYVPLRKEVSNEVKMESWSQLPLGELTKVEIGDEGENGNWENIFLQIIDAKHMSMFDDLRDLIREHVSKQKLALATLSDKDKQVYDFKPLHNCIVKYDNVYLRAKVHGVFGNNIKDRLYRFFLCDYACFTNVKSHELYNDFLYETTEEIVNFIPYQAIHCTLAGIQWDRFAKRFQVTKDYLYASAVEERSDEEKKALGLNNMPIHSYKILLYECEKPDDFDAAEMFNLTLLDKGITTKDETTKHYLDYKLKFDDDSNTIENDEEYFISKAVERSSGNSSSGSDICTFEQFLETAQKVYELDYMENNFLDEKAKESIEEIKEKTKIFEEETEIKDRKQTQENSHPADLKRTPTIIREIDDDEEDHCTSDDSENKKSSISLSSSNDNSSITTPMPALKALYKRPMTTWYETDCVIFISIHAPDITNYDLEVSQNTVYFSTKIQDDEYVLFLNLLGSVDPKYTSHEIKGLNVIVRLLKRVFMPWPRLLEETTKYSWLKYNFNTFDSKELECIMPLQRLQSVLENTRAINEAQIYDEMDSDDSERDLFQTFNPIETNGEDYDPFS